MKTKALVIFYPDCIEFEALLAAQVLHEENITLDVATPDGADYLGPSGIALRATHSYIAVEGRVEVERGYDADRDAADPERQVALTGSSPGAPGVPFIASQMEVMGTVIARTKFGALVAAAARRFVQPAASRRGRPNSRQVS